MKYFWKLLIIVELICSFHSCTWKSRPTNQVEFYRIIFQVQNFSTRACIFKILQNSSSCQSEFVNIELPCKTFYYSNIHLSKEKWIRAELLKILSELELDYPSFKTSLSSTLILSYTKEYQKKEKEFQKELEPILKKYKTKLDVLFLKEEEELKTYSELLTNHSFLSILEKSESKFLLKLPSKDLFFKEEISEYTIAKQKEDKKEFIACRQALSEKVRSTGKSGIENALNCQGLIQEEFQKNKVYMNLQKAIREKQIEKFYLQGEVWNSLQEISNSKNLVNYKILEKQVDYCYLSPGELIKKYKISKATAKSACYFLVFGISFLDFLNIQEAEVLQKDEFLRYISVHPQIFFECNPSPPAKKKS